MDIKARFAVLALSASILLILLVFVAPWAAGFYQSAQGKLLTPALAQSSSPPTPEPLILSDKQDIYPLGLNLEILEDPGGELTIEEVTSPEFDSQFTPSQAAVPNLGFTDSAYWVRFLVQNETSPVDQWLLELAYANIHFVDLYTPTPDGKAFDVKKTGVMRPPETRDILHPHITFNLTIPTHSQQTTYLRIKSGASIALPFILWTPTAFFNESQWLQLVQVLIFGALTGLLIYNLLLFLSLREATYLYLVIVIASIIVFDASYAGYLEVYFIPNLYYLRNYYIRLSFALFFISMILFTDTFLELKAHLPKLHQVNKAILGVWGGLTLLIPFTRYYIGAILMVPWAFLTLVVVLIAGILTWRKDFRPAKLFMIAWFVLIISFILVLFVRLGLIPSTIFSENAYRLGLVWMAVCWSIALADRINMLKAETEETNLELRNSENRLSQILEGLPLGVVVYGKDQKPNYVNRRSIDMLSNPSRDIQVDISAGRTLAQALKYFSFHQAGSEQEYPLERMPIYSALKGEPASVDDIEADLVDRRVPLEMWASPVKDEAGNVESAVAAFQDISQRKQAEAELIEYRNHLENLVEERTAALYEANEQLQMQVKWLSAINLVDQIMAREADFSKIYAKIIEIINDLFASEDSFVAEWVEENTKLKILAHSCRSDSHPVLTDSVTTPVDMILSNKELRRGNLVIFSKNQLSPLSGPIGEHFRGTPIHTIALVPLELRERIIGYLGLELHGEKRVITSEESALLNIFSFDIAKLIEDNRLFEQQKTLITQEERNRLARDLHDSVTQVLFSATLLAEVLPKIWERDPERGMQSLDKLQRLTHGALAEMRTMLLELRPSAVINTPLGELLAQLTEAVSSQSGLLFHLFMEQIPPLPEEVQISFYRIAQESLNNIVKHAQAKNVNLSLTAAPLSPDSTGEANHEVKLVIKDDGVGFSPGMAFTDQLGINIMQERADAIEAVFSLDSKPGYGTEMTVTWRNNSGNLLWKKQNRFES